jgi:hypothetical protein
VGVLNIAKNRIIIVITVDAIIVMTLTLTSLPPPVTALHASDARTKADSKQNDKSIPFHNILFIRSQCNAWLIAPLFDRTQICQPIQVLVSAVRL